MQHTDQAILHELRKINRQLNPLPALLKLFFLGGSAFLAVFAICALLHSVGH